MVALNGSPGMSTAYSSLSQANGDGEDEENDMFNSPMLDGIHDRRSMHASKLQQRIIARRPSLRILLALLAAVAIIAGLAGSDTVSKYAGQVSSTLAETSAISSLRLTSSTKPSADVLPPARCTLPANMRRFTMVNIWTSDNRPFYFNNFFRSVALNADVADLLVIHVTKDKSKCLDGRNEFSKTDGIHRDTAWDWENGGNIRVECISPEAYLAIKADFLCNRQTGWDCTDEQHKAVLARLRLRPDVINNEWKTLRGEMFKDYFINKELLLWAWVDMDTHLGRLTHIPFGLASTLNFMTLSPFTPSLIFLPGQFVLFNLAAPNFIGSWKKHTALLTPEAFVRSSDPHDNGWAEGGMDEIWLSAAYMRHTEGYAGQGLSWAMLPDVHGQDIFIPGRKFVISGRDVLEVDADLTREEIEAILVMAATEPIDEYGGWSEQGYSIKTPMLKGEACNHVAWFDPDAAQCWSGHNLTAGTQLTPHDSVYRGTVMRLGDDPVDQLRLRLEPDRRPRRWQRKWFLHYQEIKRQSWWWTLPEYFIGDNDEVMEFDWKDQVVWRKGSNRDKDVYRSHNSRLNADGTSAHIPESDDKTRFAKRIVHSRLDRKW